MRIARGFVRHDYYISAALLLVTLAVVVPKAHSHGLKGALLALAGVAAVVVAGAALLLGATWMLERGGLRRWLGHGLRGLGFGLLGAVLGTTLVHGHGLSVAGENRASLLAGILGALAGMLLHRRLGPERFWPAFGRFGFALLGSLVFGCLGILAGDWGVSLGVLAPLVVFAILAASGRIVPPSGRDHPASPG
jgi:hypothetical protein